MIGESRGCCKDPKLADREAHPQPSQLGKLQAKVTHTHTHIFITKRKRKRQNPQIKNVNAWRLVLRSRPVSFATIEQLTLAVVDPYLEPILTCTT